MTMLPRVVVPSSGPSMPLKIFNYPRDSPMCDCCTFTLLLHDAKIVKYML